MKAETKSKLVSILSGARSALVWVPDVPGIIDNIAVGSARVIISAVIRALDMGKSVEDIVGELETLSPAERLSVADEITKFAEGSREE